MRRSFFAFLVPLTACSLLNPLDGFEGPGVQEPAIDAAQPPLDGPRDVTPSPDGARDGGDGGVDPAAAYVAAVVADAPLGYWRFEEPSGPVAPDTMGKFDGVHVATALGESGILPGTHAVSFPADARAHVTIAGNVFRFPGAAPYTVELWALPKSFRSYLFIGGTEGPSFPRAGWSVPVDGTGLLSNEFWKAPPDGGMNDQIRGTFLFSRLLVTGRFQHIVFTFDGATTNGYLDGDLLRTVASPKLAADVGQLAWGCRLKDMTFEDCIDGWVLDEIAVYDHPLTAARVKVHHDLGAP